MIRLLAVTLIYTAFAGKCTTSSEEAVGFISGNQYVGTGGIQQHSPAGATYDKPNGAQCRTHYECKSGFCKNGGSDSVSCSCSGWRNNNYRGGPECSSAGHDKPWCYVDKNSGCPDKKGSGVPWSELACKPKEKPKVDFTKKYDGDIYEGEPGVCLISYHSSRESAEHPEMSRHYYECPLRTVGDYCEESWDCDEYKCVNNKCLASSMNWSDEVFLWDERNWDERIKGSEGLSEMAVGIKEKAVAGHDEIGECCFFHAEIVALGGKEEGLEYTQVMKEIHDCDHDCVSISRDRSNICGSPDGPNARACCYVQRRLEEMASAGVPAGTNPMQFYKNHPEEFAKYKGSTEGKMLRMARKTLECSKYSNNGCGSTAASAAFVTQVDQATSYVVNGFALLGIGALFYGAGAHYLKKQDTTHVEF